MKNLVRLFLMMFTVSIMFTSCRDTKENDVEESMEDVADDVEDAADDVEDELDD